MITQRNVIVGLALFYGLFFGFYVRLSYFPDMPNEHWLGLLILIWFTYNVIAFSKGWTLQFIYSSSPANEAKWKRIVALIISIVVIIGVLYSWFNLGTNVKFE